MDDCRGIFFSSLKRIHRWVECLGVLWTSDVLKNVGVTVEA